MATFLRRLDTWRGLLDLQDMPEQLPVITEDWGFTARTYAELGLEPELPPFFPRVEPTLGERP